MFRSKPKHEAGLPRLLKQACLFMADCLNWMKRIFQRAEDSVVEAVEKTEVGAKVTAAGRRWARKHPDAALLIRIGLCLGLLTACAFFVPTISTFIHFKAIFATVQGIFNNLLLWHHSWLDIREAFLFVQPPEAMITFPTALDILKLLAGFVATDIVTNLDSDLMQLWREFSWARIILEKAFGVHTIRELVRQICTVTRTA